MTLRWRHALHLLWGLPGAAILLALLLALAPFVLLRQRAVRDWALDTSRAAALFSGEARIRVASVARFDPSGFTVRGVTVERKVETAWRSWLSVGSIDVRIRPEDLLSRRLSISNLTVDSVRVDLANAPVPIFASAAPGGSKRRARPPELPAIRCGTFAVRNVSVEAAEGKVWRGELELSGLDHASGHVRGTLRRAAVATDPDTLYFALEDGLVEGELVSRFGLSAVKMRGPGLQGRLDGGWQAAAISPDSSSHVLAELAIGAFEPAQVSALRATGLPFAAEDRLAGRISTHLTLPPSAPPFADLSLDLTGFLFGTGLDTLLVAVSASPDRARLDGLRLRCGEMGLSGAASVARPGRASLSLQVDQVDLSAPPIARFAPELPASRLSGRVEAEAESLGPRIRLRAELALEPGELLGRPLSGLFARARLDPEALVIEHLHTLGGDSVAPVIELSGRLDRARQTLSAEGRLHDLTLEDWVAPWLDGVTLEGRVSGPVRIAGTWRRPEVAGDLSWSEGRAEGVTLETLQLGGLSGTLQPLRLKGNVSAAHIDAYGVGIDSVRGPVTLGDTIRTRLSAFVDTTRLDLRARVAPYTRGAVYFDSFTVRAGDAPEVVLDAPSRLSWAPELVRIDSIRVRSAAGTLAGSGRIEPRPGQGGTEPFRFRTQADGIDLRALASYFGLPSQHLSGSASGEFSGEGTLEAPRYRYHLVGLGLSTYDWFWDEVELAGSAGEGIGFFVDSLRVRSSGYLGPLPGNDQVGPSLPGPPLLVRGDSLRVDFGRPWKPLLVDLADTALVAEALAQARVDGRISVRGLPVAPILAPVMRARGVDQGSNVLNESLDPMLAKIEVVRPAAAEEAARRPSGIGGSVDLTADFGGTGSDLEVALDLTGRGVWVYQAWADSVRLRATAGDSRWKVEEFRWQMGETDLAATADLGLRLTANPPLIRDTGKPGWLEADLHEADLALLSLVTGVVQDPVGRLDGHVRTEIVAGHPKLSGEVAVRDGAFRIPGREERFSKIDADGVIDSLGMHVEATGRLNQTGKVRLEGLVRDIDDFDLTARVTEAPVYETGNYRFLAEADLRARAEMEGDTSRPHVTGTARVLEGLITQDLSKPPARLPPRTPWLIDLEVEAPGNLRLNQPYTTVDLGEGRLNVSFRWPYWNLGGSLEVLNGTYRLFNRNLRITSGTVTFEDTGQGPNPRLEVEAETTLPVPESENNNEIQVVLTVTGYPAKKEMEVSLTGTDNDGKSYSEAELIERMSLGQIQSAEFGTFSSSDPTRQALSSELVGQIERQLVGQLPWADRVQLEGEFGGPDPMSISVRPIVQPQWSVLYSQELSASPEREVSVRYRLSNLLFLNAAVDRAGQEKEGVPLETYTLDLKLRFEY